VAGKFFGVTFASREDPRPGQDHQGCGRAKVPGAVSTSFQFIREQALEARSDRMGSSRTRLQGARDWSAPRRLLQPGVMHILFRHRASARTNMARIGSAANRLSNAASRTPCSPPVARRASSSARTPSAWRICSPWECTNAPQHASLVGVGEPPPAWPVRIDSELQCLIGAVIVGLMIGKIRIPC